MPASPRRGGGRRRTMGVGVTQRASNWKRRGASKAMSLGVGDGGNVRRRRRLYKLAEINFSYQL